MRGGGEGASRVTSDVGTAAARPDRKKRDVLRIFMGVKVYGDE